MWQQAELMKVSSALLFLHGSLADIVKQQPHNWILTTSTAWSLIHPLLAYFTLGNKHNRSKRSAGTWPSHPCMAVKHPASVLLQVLPSQATYR
jgi:hypothetical protein